MKKYIFGAVLSIGLLVSPAFTQAAGLTSSQVQAILSLLSSFGAEQSVINNVQASLTGSAPTTGGQSWCHYFNSDLTVGSNGGDVSALNQALSSSGIDTTGNDTNFTENDAADVVAFQSHYGIRQTGYVGPMTRAKLNALYGCRNGQQPTQPITQTTTTTTTQSTTPVVDPQATQPTTPAATFSAFPTSGVTPLAVMFRVTIEPASTGSALNIDFGDGTMGTTHPTGVGCSISYCPYYGGANHIYASAGTYTAKLTRPSACNASAGYTCTNEILGTQTITVTTAQQTTTTAVSTSCAYRSNSGGATRTMSPSQSNTLDTCKASCSISRNEVFGQTDSGICTFTDINGNSSTITIVPAVSPTISITASSVGIASAMNMAVQYEHMPSAGVRIINSSGTTVWTQELTAGGGGQTSVSFSSVLPAGFYTAQAVGSDGAVYATSAPYYFALPDVSFTASSGQSITLMVGQSATDGGIKITLVSLTPSDSASGASIVNMNVTVNGLQPGFYSTAAGGTVGSSGGFSDSTSSTGGVTITVSSVSRQTNTATLLVSTTAPRG